MAQCLKLDVPNGEMKRRPRCNQAGCQLLKERENIAALQLPTKHHLAIRIDAMDLKNRLRDIETDYRDRLHV
jgi:hypothetical protein